jgi:hypothetical protein
MANKFMDIGQIGNDNITFKRKFRWILYLGNYEMYMAKMASRPKLNVEETVVDHLHEKHYLSGKPSWDTVNMTLYDVKTSNDVGDPSANTSLLINWVRSVFNISQNPAFTSAGTTYNFLDMGDHDLEYKQDLTIQMLNGHGQIMETWWLVGAFPTSAAWGDLDYASNDTADLELTVRFDRAMYYDGNGTAISNQFAQGQ